MTDKPQLVTVVVTTKLGAEHSFPDMDADAIDSAIPESGRSPSGQPSLHLMNVSCSILSILFAVIARVHVDGELRWEAPNLSA